ATAGHSVVSKYKERNRNMAKIETIHGVENREVVGGQALILSGLSMLNAYFFLFPGWRLSRLHRATLVL
ncbi:MAG: hypothetical protein WA376_12545, partial [Terrimicrobiaceae bacterium]